VAEISALQKQFFGDDWLSPSKAMTVPTTDVYMKDNNLIVEAHLPNFNKDDVSIEIENGALTISAEKHEKVEDKDKQYIVRESASTFYRRVALPERADADKIKADLDDGVLKVQIPLEPLPQPKKVAISSKKKDGKK